MAYSQAERCVTVGYSKLRVQQVRTLHHHLHVLACRLGSMGLKWKDVKEQQISNIYREDKLESVGDLKKEHKDMLN